MGTTEALTDIHAAWNTGLRGKWDPEIGYLAGDAVTGPNGLSGWVAVAPSRGVRPSRDDEAWVMVWASSGQGLVGASREHSRS
jgi:hypothetical protein